MRTLFTFLILILLNITVATAHALFIKTESKGNINNPHTVKIFYAEAENGKKEKLTDWWSNTKDFTLWLHFPDGSEQKLEITPENDHYLAVFTPKTEGYYHLNIHHDVEEKFDKTQYQFNAAAQVLVGNSEQKNDIPYKGLNMQITSHNNATKVQVTDHNAAVPKIPITFYAPNGWKKTLTTDKQGTVNFQPLWEGDYLVETFKVDPVSAEDYDKKYRILTTVLHIMQ